MLKHYLKLFAIPLSVLVTFLLTFFIWKVFNLPPGEVIAASLNVWFTTYGPIVILMSAFLEGLILLGAYFPGIFIIFVSVVTAASLPEALFRIAIGSAGLILAHIANYALGKYGWYVLLQRFGLKSSIAEMQRKLEKQETFAIFASYWLPKVGSLADTAAGILHMPFRKFISASILASLFWNFLVGIAAYFIGDSALAMVTSGGTTELVIQFAVVIVWMAILLAFDYHKRKKTRSILL